MKPKFKVGDLVKIVNRGRGFDGATGRVKIGPNIDAEKFWYELEPVTAIYPDKTTTGSWSENYLALAKNGLERVLEDIPE